MARLSLDNSVKFKRLVAASKLPRPYVKGLLQTLWDSIHEGSPVIGDATSVEVASEWPGTAGEWFELLRKEKWIEPAGKDIWRVHDYWQHCPDFVVKRYARQNGLQFKGLRLTLCEEYRNQKPSAGRKRNPPDSTIYSAESNGEKRTPLPAPPRPAPPRPDLTPPPVAGSVFAIPAELDSPEFQTAWSEWVAYRDERKPKVTPLSASKAFSEMAGWGIDRAIRAINHSIASGYQGVFEPASVTNGQVGKPRPIDAVSEKFLARATQ